MDVVDGIVDETDAVVAALRHPNRDVAFGEPAPPADLQGLAEIVMAGGRDDRPEGDEAENDQLAGKAGPVARLERVEEPRIPLDHRHRDIDEAKLGADHAGEQSMCAPAVLGAKIGQCESQKGTQGDDNAVHDSGLAENEPHYSHEPGCIPKSIKALGQTAAARRSGVFPAAQLAVDQ